MPRLIRYLWLWERNRHQYDFFGLVDKLCHYMMFLTNLRHNYCFRIILYRFKKLLTALHIGVTSFMDGPLTNQILTVWMGYFSVKIIFTRVNPIKFWPNTFPRLPLLSLLACKMKNLKK